MRDQYRRKRDLFNGLGKKMRTMLPGGWWWVALWSGLVSGMLAPCYALGSWLIADSSDHIITVDTRFHGTDILLFGARQPGDLTSHPADVVVVLRGPKQRYLLYRKERVAGIWVNRHPVRLPETDAFYSLVSSRALPQIEPPSMLQALGLVEHALSIPLHTRDRSSGLSTMAPYWQALLAAKQSDHLYQYAPEPMVFLGEVLFRVPIHLPKNIPQGRYIAETYMIQHGQLLASHMIPIDVEQVGLQAMIAAFAVNHPAWYGCVAVLMAVLVGWGASILLTRR